MNKVKTMLKGISENIKQVTSRYPVTMVLIVLVSLTAAVFIDQSGSLGKFMENKGLPFLILWGIGTFFTETYFPEKKAAKWCGITAAGLISAALIRLDNSSSAAIRDISSRWTAAYVIVLVTLGVYRNYKNSGLPFNQYCLRVVHELSRLAIISSITGSGIVLVTATFVELILNGEHFMLILRAEFLVLGILTGSGWLNALIKKDRELPRFFIVIVKYLLMVLLLAAFAIIYGYILKIVITRIVPSNEIFRILAGLFIIGLPIWTLIGTFPEDHFLVRTGVKLPYIFIPFLFLQGYAIRERILAYGMTPFRYLCLALMLFEIIYIIVYALRRRETGIMLPVFALLAVISLVVPGVNMFSVANRSQKAIFDSYISADFSNLSTEDQSSLAGAYYYLRDNEEGKAMLAEIDTAKIEAIKASGMTGDREYDRNIYFDYEFPLIGEDIRSFSRLTLVSNENATSERDKENYDPEKIELFDGEGNLILTADLSGFINQCISAEAENQTGTPDFPGTVELEDGNLLRITQIHCGMSIDPKQEFNYLYLDALLLERE